MQACKEGQCEPFYPEDIKPITEPPSNDLEPKTAEDPDESTKSDKSDTESLVDGRPAWYDPIFTEMFIELKMKFEERFKP